MKAKSESLCLVPKGRIHIIKGDIKAKSEVFKSYGCNCEDSGQGLCGQMVFHRRCIPCIPIPYLGLMNSTKNSHL